MNAAETAALRALQDDLFRARTELAHARACIENALRRLKAAPVEAARNVADYDKALNLATVCDEVKSELDRVWSVE